MAWDPALYLAHAGPRLQPAVDLLARVAADAPQEVCDLGCGTGTSTRLLRARWPAARVVGVDDSAEMLAKAAAEPAEVEWVRADAAAWQSERPLDVLFSNACLHWLPDHERLFPKLLAQLAPGGTLAVQMPRNHEARAIATIRELAQEPPWRGRIDAQLLPAPVPPPAFYYDLLAPRTAELALWETEYLHVLEGDAPVVEWTMGTTLSGLLAALDDETREAFLAEFAARVTPEYPPSADGRTLFPFRRLFLIAR